jgi:hypothetical protein
MREFLKRKIELPIEVDREYLAIGIDPGVKGAIVVIKGNVILHTLPMPLDEEGAVSGKGIYKVLRELCASYHHPIKFIAVEKVPPTIGMVGGVASQFKLGCAYGKTLCAVEMITDTDVPEGEELPNGFLGYTPPAMILISPRKWQYHLGLKEHKESIEWVKTNMEGSDLCQGPRGGWRDGATDAVCIAYSAYSRRGSHE